MKKHIFYQSTFAALLLGCVLFAKASHADILSDVQVQCLTNLARFEGINPSESPLQQAVKNNVSDAFSFPSLQKAALDDGMKVTTQKISFAKLRKLGAPAIARLHNPEELITIAAIGQQNAIIYEGTNLQIMPVKVLSTRYDGEALFYEHYLHQQPHIKIDEPVRDVKITTLGGAFPFSVPVENTGKNSITLKVQSTSCGCTSDDNSEQELKPRQSGELHFKTTANSDRVVTAMIATNDPAKPVFVLAFQITLPKTSLPIIPGLQLNGNIGQEITATFPVKLPQDVSIKKIVASPKFIAAKLLNIKEQEHIGVTVKSSAPAGSFSGNITLLLKGSDITQLSVPVSGYINDGAFFTPALVSVNGPNTSYKVILQSPVRKIFAITDWRSDNSAIEVHAPRNQFADIQHITIKMRTPENGRIVFTLDDGREVNLDVIKSYMK